MNLCALTAKSRSRPMGMPAGNTAPMRVMWLTGSGVARMGEEQFQNEKMYHATMSIAKSLMEQGAMTAEEYGQIDTIFRNKYHPILVSLQTEMSGYKAAYRACSAGTEKEEEGGGLCQGVDGDGNAPPFPFRAGQPLQRIDTKKS